MTGMTVDTVIAKQSSLDTYGKTVVIDPGHGGHDTGARGPAGAEEKAVTLNLAQMILEKLNIRYRVLLTRTGDYWLDIPGRTAVANQANADVFISIHTGGSYRHQAKGLSLIYFEELSTISLVKDTEKSTPQNIGEQAQPWDTLHIQHLSVSTKLAAILKSHLEAGNKYSINSTRGAPILILRGADMPAVLIEVGYLTNPLEEKTLLDMEVLDDLAQKISEGIIDYFEKRP
jgi:N-acetylmuramoyl-L-alanine amidase